MNRFYRILIQLAFFLLFIFSRIIAHSFREYSQSFLVFNSISQQLVQFLTFIILSLLLPLFLPLFAVRYLAIFSGFSLKFLALSLTNLLLYCITTPPNIGIFTIVSPFFFFIGIILWHKKILQDIIISMTIAMVVNFLITIFQNPVFPIHSQLFVQQLYYGRSAGVIGINQNGAFISIYLSFLIFFLSNDFFNCYNLFKLKFFNFRAVYLGFVILGFLSLFLTISRISIVYFLGVILFKYFRFSRVPAISRKTLMLLLIFIVASVSLSLFMLNNFSYLFIRISRIDDILLNSDNLRYAQLSRFVDSIFLEVPSNLFGLSSSSEFINTFGDNMWLESTIAFGFLYTTSLFCMYLFSFMKLRSIAYWAFSLKLRSLNRIALALSYVSVGIVFLSCFYGGLQSIPISSTYFLLVGLVYAESGYSSGRQLKSR